MTARQLAAFHLGEEGRGVDETYWGLRFLALVVATWAASLLFGFALGVSVLTIVGLVAALVGIFKPTIGLFGVGILCVLDSVTRVLLMTGGWFRYNTFNYVLLVAMLVAFPKVLRIVDAQTRLLMGLALLMFLGLSISPDVAGGAFGLLNLAAEFGLLLYFMRAREQGNSLYWLALVNAVLAVMACVVFFLQIHSVRPINPNAWSYMPVTALFTVCLAYPSVEVRWQKVLLLALSLANCACVFLSASRGSMLVATVCVCYLLFLTRSTAMKLSFVGVGALLLVMATAVFPDMQAYALHRVDKLFDDRYSLGGRTSGRSELAETGIRMFLDNPFGRGTGAFAVDLVDIEGYSKQSHSGWIKTLVENGIIGALFLGAFIGSFGFLGWKERKRRGAFALGLLVTFGLSFAFFSTEFNAKGLWFLAAGATAVLCYPVRRNSVLHLRLPLPQSGDGVLARFPNTRAS